MKLTVAFDCDDTLIKWSDDGRAIPNHNVIDLLRWFMRNGHKVVVWSGGGVEYAQTWVEKFNLHGIDPLNDVIVVEKGSIPVDIAIDDGGGEDFTAQEYEKQILACAKVTLHV